MWRIWCERIANSINYFMSSDRGTKCSDLCTRWPKIQQMDHKMTPEKENNRRRVMDHKDMFAIDTMLIITVPLFYRLSSSSYRLPYPPYLILFLPIPWCPLPSRKVLGMGGDLDSSQRPTNKGQLQILIPSGALCLKWQPSHKKLYGTPAETWGLKLKAAGFLGWMGGGGGDWP